MFEFLGQLFGLAIRTKLLLPLNFPPIIWKKLTGEVVTRRDVEMIDTLSFNILRHVEV